MVPYGDTLPLKTILISKDVNSGKPVTLNLWSLKSLSNTSSPIDGSIVTSNDPSVLNGVYSISLILLVSSPPLTLKYPSNWWRWSYTCSNSNI